MGPTPAQGRDTHTHQLANSKYAFLTANCHDMPTDQLATLRVGQTVTLIGDFDDGGDHASK